ncbi:MAG: cytidine deaminase [Candidatus Cloacimonetes bacterium]|nr:cytidine deaminase [Candidatus Cloacimonadota bacterium]
MNNEKNQSNLKQTELSIELKNLFDSAKIASENAYSPYSHFKVGAAILCKNGKQFTGCNIENASFGGTICAERVAICKAVSENEKEFTAIAVYVQSEKLFPPCGMCRQFMVEFSTDMIVIYGNEQYLEISNIGELLPESFKL